MAFFTLNQIIRFLEFILILFLVFLYKDLVLPIFLELGGNTPFYYNKFFFVLLHILNIPYALLWASRKIRPFILEGEIVIPYRDDSVFFLLLYLTVFLCLLYWDVFFPYHSLLFFTYAILVAFLNYLLEVCLLILILFLSYYCVPDYTLPFLPGGWALFWISVRLVIFFLIFPWPTFPNFILLGSILLFFIICFL